MKRTLAEWIIRLTNGYIKATGKELDEVNLEEMDFIWNQIKHNE